MRNRKSANERTKHRLGGKRFRPGLEALESRCLLSGDAVLRWNQLALDAVALDHGQSPPAHPGPVLASRALAIVHVAMYDAANAIDQTHASYLVDLVAPSGTSLGAAIAQAAHDTLAALYPSQKATFDAALAADLAAIPDGPAETDGIGVGQLVAARVLVARGHDGTQEPVPYTVITDPGNWQPDAMNPGQNAYMPGGGLVTPFALTSGSQFRSPAPPALGSPEYTAAYNEVKALGGDGITTPTSRTPEQTEIGIFWGYDGRPGLGVPPNLYNQIARSIADQLGNTEMQNARLFALINIAMADAGVGSWDTKYAYNLWRPITAIRAGEDDGNPDTAGDPNWTPLGAPLSNALGINFTPPFPAYTSGHATFGAALFQTLANFYGTDNLHFTLSSDEFNGVTTDNTGAVRPVVTRDFDSFSEAAEENGQSRIFLGIHWSFDKTEGIAMGNSIADFVFEHFLQSRISDNERFVTQIYPALLGREGDGPGVAFWTDMLDNGMSRPEVVAAIETTLEHKLALVRDLYLDLLDREPDQAGLIHFVTFLQLGGTVAHAEAAILGSPEYLALHGGTDAGFLAGLYEDLMDRTIDRFGLAFFGQALANGATNLAIATAVLESDECLTQTVQDSFETMLHHEVSGAALDTLVTFMHGGLQADQLVAAILMSEEFFVQVNR